MSQSVSAFLKIDLDQFKLFLDTQKTGKITLHFNTPSRRFYLSVIAFVLEEMRERGTDSVVALSDHADVLAVLNETVGGGAGSSKRKRLLPRIYKKWKSALPDLENAPLFMVLGKTKEFGDAAGKVYRFDESVKDAWANLFEYKGSLENARLRFSVETLGIEIETVDLIYDKASIKDEKGAWDRFLKSLSEDLEEEHVASEHDQRHKEPETVDLIEDEAEIKKNEGASDHKKSRQTSGTQIPAEPASNNSTTPIQVGDPIRNSMEVPTDKENRLKKRKKSALMLIFGLLLSMAAVALWKFYLHPTFRQESLKSAPTLSSEASIAVLPFANISGDSKEDYLSDGITEQIITALSKTPRMLVIARNSVFTYKGKPVKVQQIGEELGVRYLLEGSVQKSGNRLRITAQLIDAKTGNHLWSELYDRELKDIFAIQDEITMEIIAGLRVNLTEGEQGHIYSAGTENLKAYLKALEGGDLAMSLRSKDDNALARQVIEEAIALDPEYVNAYVLLAWTHLHDWTYGWTKKRKKSLERGLEIGLKAVSIDEFNPSAHSVVEASYRRLGILDKALAAGKRAVALAPNGAEINALHSATLLRVGMNEKALARINKAIHLNPIPPMWYFTVQGYAYRNLGHYEEAVKSYKKAIALKPKYVTTVCGLGEVYRMMGQNEEAIRTFNKALQINPNFQRAHVQLVVSYSLAGQKEKAHAEVKEVFRTNPQFTVDGFSNSYLRGHKKEQKDIIVNALKEAGLK